MEAALSSLGTTGVASGGGSSGASNDVNTAAKADLSSEESSGPVEAPELELGLGLSLGGGWAERGRILTAKDFPTGFSGRVTASVGAVSGTKRTAELVSRGGGSPPATRIGSSRVVGWPPVRTYRINSLVNQAKNQRAEEQSKQLSPMDVSKSNATDTEKGPHGFVKVYMDGVLIGRKVDLNAHFCYETLALMLEDMFFKSMGSLQSTGLDGDDNEHASKLSQLLNGTSEFVLTYEDKEGDWMLVGDVPWGMFLSSVKKLRIMRTSEVKGSTRFKMSKE